MLRIVRVNGLSWKAFRTQKEQSAKLIALIHFLVC